MDRFFVVVGRTNQVLFLLIMLGAAAFLMIALISHLTAMRYGAVEAKPGKSGTALASHLKFGKAEKIHGADVHMVHLVSAAGDSVVSYKGYTSNVRNVLFKADSEKAGRWLFKDNDGLVVASEQLQEPTDSIGKQGQTRAVYLEYVGKDSNGDNSLSSADVLDVALAKPDGSGLVVVLKDVDNVVSQAYSGYADITVIYQRGRSLRHAKFALDGFKLVFDQELASLPASP